MAVTMNDVKAALDPEEPNYEKAAKLGAEALPHLEALVSSGDTMLASKATYLASLIKDDKSSDIISAAAQSDDPVVRVAAAAAASNLTAAGASPILEELVGDPDPGVRKVARTSVPAKPTAALTRKLEDLGDEGEGAADEPSEPGGPVSMGAMPGEASEDDPASVGSTMPGERTGGMPGEQQKMPGE
jgi:hypothetical protein